MSTTRVRLREAAELARRGWPGPIHPLDASYAILSGWKFSAGWGDEAVLRRFETGNPFDVMPEPLLPTFGPWQTNQRDRQYRDGTFPSPLTGQVPASVAAGLVRHLRNPFVARIATVVILSGSGEEGFGLRTGIHGALVDQGIELWLLESPYYGHRRAPGQRSEDVPQVSEQALMNLGMIVEAGGLLLGLHQIDAGPLGVAGYSMGAYMAVQVAVRLPFEVAIAVLAGGDSARDIYTLGLLSLSIDFARLGGGDAPAARERLGAFYHRTRASLLPLPRRPDAAVIVGATRDGYVPSTETRALHLLWRGSVLHTISGGHISAAVMARRALREAVAESIAQLTSRSS